MALEKVGEDQLDRSCDKGRSIKKGPREVELKSYKKRFFSAAAFTKHVLHCTDVLWKVHGERGRFHTGCWWGN